MKKDITKKEKIDEKHKNKKDIKNRKNGKTNMNKKEIPVKVINFPVRIKYKKFCKNIYKQYRRTYISYDEDGKPIIDINFLMNILVSKLKPKVNTTYIRNKKYEEIDFINGIIDVINNCAYWNRYKGLINGKYLNKRHNMYNKWGVYECLLRIILLSYFSTNKFNKLKNQAIDSTFIKNLYGNDIYGRNVKYKSKNGINISGIVDYNGVPISLAITPANNHDSMVAIEQLKHFIIEPETKKVKNNNKYKQNMFGDASYYTKNVHDILRKLGYTPITDTNKRNVKNPFLLKKIKKDKNKYIKKGVKRLVVERFNAWIHEYPKIDRFIEKSIESFKGLLLLACSLKVLRKITNLNS
jgi:hypothetical protein